MNDYVRELDELRPTGFRAHDTHRLNQLFSTQNKKEVSKSAKGARQAHLLSSTLARELDLCACGLARSMLSRLQTRTHSLFTVGLILLACSEIFRSPGDKLFATDNCKHRHDEGCSWLMKMHDRGHDALHGALDPVFAGIGSGLKGFIEGGHEQFEPTVTAHDLSDDFVEGVQDTALTLEHGIEDGIQDTVHGIENFEESTHGGFEPEVSAADVGNHFEEDVEDIEAAIEEEVKDIGETIEEKIEDVEEDLGMIEVSSPPPKPDPTPNPELEVAPVAPEVAPVALEVAVDPPELPAAEETAAASPIEKAPSPTEE